MFNLICNKKGISLVEVLIASFLITFGILALLSLQPSAWSLSGKSDFLGRAAGLLHKEMETVEVFLMNPNNANPCATTNPLVMTQNVFSSGLNPAQSGDIPYTMQTTIQDNGDNSWTVRVRVTWEGNNTGISETLLVTRQENFRS